MRLVGQFFKGVLASGTLPPDASQDVATVNADRSRIIVADGAGDTGSTAGEWAQVLSLCYVASREAASTRKPEWLRRAVDAWRTTSHVAQLAADGQNLSRGEVNLFRQGVEASFVAATFSERPELTVQWIAAGDCEAMLFRRSRLIEWGPVRNWRDFSSFPGGASSNDETSATPFFGEWALEPHDTILFATDALACYVMRQCQAMDNFVPSSLDHLFSLDDWSKVREWVDAARGQGVDDLEDDDVAIVRVVIEEDFHGSGPFILRRQQPSASQSVERRRNLSILGPAPTMDSAADSTSQGESAGTTGAIGDTSPSEAAASLRPGIEDELPTTYWGAGPPRPFSWTTFVAGGAIGAVALAVVLSLTDRMVGRHPAVSQRTPLRKDTIGRPSPNVIVEVEPSRSLVPAVATAPQVVAATKQPMRPSGSGAQSHSLRHTGGTREATKDSGVARPPPITATAASPTEKLLAGGAPAVVSASDAPPPEVAPATHADVKPAGGDRAPCTVPKNTKLFGHGDDQRKMPLLVVDAKTLPCKFGPDESDHLLLFIAWARVSADSSPEALKWIDQRKLPEASNVWIAPQGEYLGNLKAGTPFISKQRKAIEQDLWVELLISAVR